RPGAQPDDPAHARAQAGARHPQHLQRLLVLGPPVGRGPAPRPARRDERDPPGLGPDHPRTPRRLGRGRPVALPRVEQARSEVDRNNMARLLSVNVGLPRDIEWKGRTVHTGIWKDPVPGRCRVRRLNLDGDGQGDLAGHGGEQRAVFVYQIESYRYWQEQLKRTDFVHGQFGENFTIEGLPDDA